MKTTSKNTILSLGITAVVCLSQSANAATLFADSFDRGDSDDLNAAATGKSGSLGALDWVELDGSGGTAVASNELEIGETNAGGGWAIAYVNHNFTDDLIFTVSIELGDNLSFHRRNAFCGLRGRPLQG
jgi:hypothetical protein